MIADDLARRRPASCERSTSRIEGLAYPGDRATKCSQRSAKGRGPSTTKESLSCPDRCCRLGHTTGGRWLRWRRQFPRAPYEVREAFSGRGDAGHRDVFAAGESIRSAATALPSAAAAHRSARRRWVQRPSRRGCPIAAIQRDRDAGRRAAVGGAERGAHFSHGLRHSARSWSSPPV